MPVEGWYADGEPWERFGVVIEDQQGWFDVPELRGSNSLVLGQHGERWRPKKRGVGRIPLTVGIHGCDEDWQVPAEGSAQRALFESNLEGFLRTVAYCHRQIDVERVHPMVNGSTPRRRALCEVANAITPQMAGYTYGRVGLELIVPGAFWSDVDSTSYRLPYDPAGADEQALEVVSLQGQTGYCADAVVTVVGPCSSVSIRDEGTGLGFAYGALAAGEILVVDSEQFTAEVDGDSIITDLTIESSNLLEISPAPSEHRGPRVVVDAPGAAVGFDITLVTRRKWLTP